MKREEAEFDSHGEACAAWHYLPGGATKKDVCIVMAHGLGATRDMGLQPFAERFAEAGYHALVFDYRHFGDSAGEPRQLLSVRKQVQDWRSATTFARTLPGISRVALWGTSFSGGHVVVAAAGDGRVDAVTAQCPMMDGLGAIKKIYDYAGAKQLMKVTGHALLDAMHAMLRIEPHRVPLVGPPGTLAAMASADAEPGFMAIAPPTFRNELAARLGLSLGLYRPVRHARKVRCPLLVQICEQDSVASTAAAERVVRRAGGKAEVLRYPIGHFDIYLGEHRERAARDQIAFFDRHLG
ncbi:MAG TPA: alpha/beta hydrolase [Myxococcaceae bacterium]|nr:alpha/beta hydrolase [Myxococcaceae bacterium]